MTSESLLKFGRAVARIAFLPAVAVIVWGELSSSGVLHFDVWDKLQHFTAYFGLAGLAWAALHRRGYATSGVIGVIVLGGVLEIIQGMVGRDMSFFDEVANTLGAVTGALLAEFVRRILEPVGGVEPKSGG